MPRPSLACVLTLVGAALSLPRTAGAEESFFEAFDTLDRGRWYRSDGWSNGPWMNCTWSRDAVTVDAGTLSLDAYLTETGVICGELQSREAFGYGLYEVRLRTTVSNPVGNGLNAAFFTYIGPVHDRAHHEIDVEILLRAPGVATFNTFVDGSPLGGGEAPVAPPSGAAFHTYAFDWRPDGIAWYVDGRLAHRTDPGAPIPEPPQKIYASLWTSDSFPDWMGPFDPDALPARVEIDWIAFTALGHPCQAARPVLCPEDWPAE
jgi:endo-1,3-1,4-beta-glycanase ExoK